MSILVAIHATHGQDRRRGGRGIEERFKQLDRDKDGVLTAREAGGVSRLKAMDANGDNKVTLAEARAWFRKQRQRNQQPEAMNGDLPKDAAAAKTIFRLAYIHNGSLAQASALLDVFGKGQPDILIACKRRVHLVKNQGKGSFTHATTYQVDNANGWGAHDFNTDGRLDAFVAQQQRQQDDCWINNGNGTFTRRNLGNETIGNTRNVLLADLDGDGHIDSYHSVSSFGTNHAGCELHPGKADGTFGPDIIRQVLEPAVPDFWYATATHPDRGKEQWANKMFKGAVVRDFDGDGKPDIVTAAYADLGFQEGGRGGIGQQWVEQQDRGLFVLHNRSKPGCIRFAEVARKAIGEYAHGNTKKHWNCYAVIPLDYDRDGDPDLFVGAVTRRHGAQPEDTRCVALYENVSKPGEIRFVDRTPKSGFGRYNAMPAAQRWQVSFASGAALDYDNDGWVDLCLINRRDKDKTRWPYPHLFRNTGKGTFVEVPTAEHGIGGGAGGRDLNYGDLDGDGRLDVIIHDGTVGGYDGEDNSRIYMNHSPGKNHWVGLKVVQGARAVPAIGARLLVCQAGTETILGSDEVRTDFCYRSKRLPVLHFGLGEMDRVDVRITMGGRKPITFKSLAANQVYTLDLSDGARPASPAAAPLPEHTALEMVAHGDVCYAKTQGVDANLQSLDIYAPKNAKKAPVMIYVHGGGWRKGDKSRVSNKPSFFNSKGWVFVSTNYRLVPRVAFPDNVADVAKAIDWACRNISRYGGDPTRIFIMGHSAGAHLVSLVATDPTYLKQCGRTLKDVKGVISLDTQAYDLVEMLDGWTSDVYSGAFGKDPKLHKVASPLHNVAAERAIPPFLICYSRGVSSQKVSNKRAMRAAAFSNKLKEKGFRAEVIDASDRNHGEISQWFGLQSDAQVTGKAWRFLETLATAAPMAVWRQSLTFNPQAGPVRPVNAMNMTAHKGRLYCGMATSMEKDRFSNKSSYVFVKESADTAWKLDVDFGPGTSRVGVLESVHFEFDAKGHRIPNGPVAVLVGFTLKLGRKSSVLQARIRDDVSGKWLTVDLPTPRAIGPNVRCVALHRDQVTGGQFLFVGASPAPLGIVKGAYDPRARGKIRWFPEVELKSISGRQPGSRGKWFGMASVDGKLFASSARQIFRRIDGPGSRWIQVASFLRQDNIDSAPPRGLTAVPVMKGAHAWKEPEMLLFSAAGRMWRMRTPDNPKEEHTLQVELNIISEANKHMKDLVVFAEGAFNRIRFCPEDGGFWPIGFQVVFGTKGVKPRARDPQSYRLKPQAWYLLRDTRGVYTFEKIEDGDRTLFLVRDFEVSPFGDHALYACGFNGSYFKGSLGTAWVYRRAFTHTECRFHLASCVFRKVLFRIGLRSEYSEYT